MRRGVEFLLRHINILTKQAKSGIINTKIDELTPCLRDSKTGELLNTKFGDINLQSARDLKKNGRYKGVGGHLFAIACQESAKAGYGGFVYFDSKTNLTAHYSKSLGAKLISGQRMYIDEFAAEKLIKEYFHGDVD